MGRLQIEDRVHQQEEKIDSKKEEASPLPPPPFHLSKENLVKDFQENGNLSQIIHKIQL